ncbi:hypothetical protein HID58_092761 [Brassica napus]|uniref:Uncharacterized protein n=1 Tax=Brassica napus TaxID=3708 RepID=A0ABQ7XDC4_BRANA|nr:hypothetical protein HID58_092761 [Brassica napus]
MNIETENIPRKLEVMTIWNRVSLELWWCMLYLRSRTTCGMEHNTHYFRLLLSSLPFICRGSRRTGAITSALRLVTKAAFDNLLTVFEKALVVLFLAFSTLIEQQRVARSKHGLAINLFLIYALTLSIFPGFLYENTGEHNLVHAFYFTAQSADQGWMVLLTSLLGLTNGYLTVCILANKPKSKYNVLETDALGNLLVSFMLGGIFAGVCLGWLWQIGTKSSF